MPPSIQQSHLPGVTDPLCLFDRHVRGVGVEEGLVQTFEAAHLPEKRMSENFPDREEFK